jgi:drug/metabolite transporter (DMT)-like permease
MHDERKALSFAVVAVLMWSTVATGFKLGLTVMTPVQLLFAGAAFSTVVFVAAALRSGWPRRHLDLKEAALFGLLNPVFYYLVLFEAYDRLPAQIAQPLNYTWAIMLAILAIPVLGQRLTVRTSAGIVVGYLGVVVLLSQGHFDALPDLDPLGVLLAVASTLLWAGYWLFNARSVTEPAALMATSFLLALPVLGVICVAGPGLPALTADTLVYGAWVGFVEMGITFLLWQRALKLSRHAARIGQLIFLSPFISLVLIGAVLGETIHVTSWIGLGIIVVGLLVTGRPRPTDKRIE